MDQLRQACAVHEPRCYGDAAVGRQRDGRDARQRLVQPAADADVGPHQYPRAHDHGSPTTHRATRSHLRGRLPANGRHRRGMDSSPGAHPTQQRVPRRGVRRAGRTTWLGCVRFRRECLECRGGSGRCVGRARTAPRTGCAAHTNHRSHRTSLGERDQLRDLHLRHGTELRWLGAAPGRGAAWRARPDALRGTPLRGWPPQSDDRGGRTDQAPKRRRHIGGRPGRT